MADNAMNSTLALLEKEPLVDIYVPGFVDSGYGIHRNFLGDRSIKRFAPLWNDIYLEFSSALLRMTAIEQGYAIQMSVTQAFDLDFEIDDADEKALSSVGWALLGTREPIRVRDLEAWHRGGQPAPVRQFAAVSIKLVTGRTVFLDAMTLDGIEVGGAEDRRAWLVHSGAGVTREHWCFVESPWLKSTSELLVKAFGGQLPAAFYRPLLLALHGLMPDRNAADIVAFAFAQPYEHVLNDLWDVASKRDVHEQALEAVRARLNTTRLLERFTEASVESQSSCVELP